MNHICPIVNGLASFNQVLIEQLKEQREIVLKCRLKLEDDSSLDLKLFSNRLIEVLSNATECITQLEEQIEFNNALAGMVLDADKKV